MAPYTSQIQTLCFSGGSGKARHPCIARERLGSSVVGRPVLLGVAAPLAESVFLDVNDAGVDFLDIFITDVPAIRYRGTEVELDNISFGTELFEYILGRILCAGPGPCNIWMG